MSFQTLFIMGMSQYKFGNELTSIYWNEQVKYIHIYIFKNESDLIWKPVNHICKVNDDLVMSTCSIDIAISLWHVVLIQN